MTLRCPECRTRRATFVAMLAHEAKSGHKKCNCGGYHFAHRPGSACCEQNRMAMLRQAVRAGHEMTTAEREDVVLDCLLGAAGRPYRGPIPF